MNDKIISKIKTALTGNQWTKINLFEIEFRDSSMCPICNMKEITYEGIHAYSHTFKKWGCEYKSALKHLPQLKYASQSYKLFRCQSCFLVFTNSYSRDLINYVEKSEFFIKNVVSPYLRLMQPYVNKYILNQLFYGDIVSLKSLDSLQVRALSHWKNLVTVILKYASKNTHFAEIGSCYGGFVEVIRNAISGIEILACEPNEFYLKELNKRYPHVKTTDKYVQDWGMSIKYDMVFCSDVIEHIWEIDDFFESVVKRMNKNGYFIIVTPNICCEGAEKLGFAWWGYLIPHHCQLFSMKSLKILGEKYGLSLEEHSTSSNNEELVVVLKKT